MHKILCLVSIESSKLSVPEIILELNIGADEYIIFERIILHKDIVYDIKTKSQSH